MCGIAGIIDTERPVYAYDLLKMANAIQHRGPDNQSVYIDPSNHSGLAHCRLSFLDLSESGNQPMCNEDRSVWITFNGEIYNFRELRVDLEKLGHKFLSNSDSEVLIHAYEEWQYGMLDKLVGMWAFAIWDERKRRLFASRDRFGIKPLYYGFQRGQFVFASEIKAIVALDKFPMTLSFSAIANYFNYRFVPSPHSIWNEVQKLPPAHYLVFENGKIKTICYWNPRNENKIEPLKDLVEEIGVILKKSVKLHAVSDVPIGAFLSGGYDSSAIAYYLKTLKYPLQTFSIGFKGWENSEDKFALLVANQLGSNHTSYVVEDTHLELLENLSWVYDEPLADISTLPTYIVSQVASKKVKAVMSGEGSDEIFVGYSWQRQFKQMDYWEKIRQSIFFQKNQNIVSYYAEAMAMGRFDRIELQKLLGPELQTYIPQDVDWFYRQNYDKTLPSIKSIQQMDRLSFMGELVLTKIDRASMANSLEVRVPFLHHELFEKVYSLNVELYHHPEQTKWLLYKQLENVFPKEILNRRKQGFVGPDSFYQNLEWYKSELANSQLIKDGILNGTVVNEYIQSQQHWKLWKIVVLEKWYQKWVSKS